jgi:hypothetical protein
MTGLIRVAVLEPLFFSFPLRDSLPLVCFLDIALIIRTVLRDACSPYSPSRQPR